MSGEESAPRAVHQDLGASTGDSAYPRTHPRHAGRVLLTAEDVAVQLQVRVKYVYRLARSGQLSSIRIGQRHLRFRQGDVDRFVEKQASASEETVQPAGLAERSRRRAVPRTPRERAASRWRVQ